MVWKLIRHRRVQALAIAALAALITTCAAFAPLYDRAMQQALVQERLAAAPVQISGLRLTARISTDSPDAVESEVPGSIRPYLRDPIPGGRVMVTEQPGAPDSPTGPLVWREGSCDHVILRDGACPRASLEVAISESDAENYGWRVGSRIPVAERISDPMLDPDASPSPTLRVVGVRRAARRLLVRPPGQWPLGRLGPRHQPAADRRPAHRPLHSRGRRGARLAGPVRRARLPARQAGRRGRRAADVDARPRGGRQADAEIALDEGEMSWARSL